jgi:hypothetical protein
MNNSEKINNAKKLGQRAYWGNVSLKDNPMQDHDSILAWEDGWKQERDFWEEHRKNKDRNLSNPRRG